MAEVRLLGPLEVWNERDGAHPVPGTKPRALLAFLALRAPELATTDAIRDALWTDDRLVHPDAALHTTVNRLRAALPTGLIATEPGGYRISDDVRTDVTIFREMAERAARLVTAGELPEAATVLRAALALWRGPALAELRDFEFAEQAARRLEEERLDVTELLMEVELDLGRHGEVVAEVGALAAANPLRERLWELWILALYRCGRQAEALGAFKTLRTTLGETLGIEPSPRIAELEERILLHDPTLSLATGAPPPARRLVTLGGVAVALAVVIGSLGMFSPDSNPDPGDALPPSSTTLTTVLAATALSDDTTAVPSGTAVEFTGLVPQPFLEAQGVIESIGARFAVSGVDLWESGPDLLAEAIVGPVDNRGFGSAGTVSDQEFTLFMAPVPGDFVLQLELPNGNLLEEPFTIPPLSNPQFVFGSDVASRHRSLIENEVTRSIRALEAVTGRLAPSLAVVVESDPVSLAAVVCAYAPNPGCDGSPDEWADQPIGLRGGHLFAHTSHPIWDSPDLLPRLHHNLVQAMVNDVGGERTRPRWVVEGLVHYLASELTMGADFPFSDEQMRVNARYDSPDRPSLDELIDPDRFMTDFDLPGRVAQYAVHVLMRDFEVTTADVLEFIETVAAGTDWEVTFINVFGVSPNAFNTHFESL